MAASPKCPVTQGYTEPGKISVCDISNTKVMEHEVGHAIDLKMNDDAFKPSILSRFPDYDRGGEAKLATERKLRDELKNVSQEVNPVKGGVVNFSDYRKEPNELMANYNILYMKTRPRQRN